MHTSKNRADRQNLITVLESASKNDIKDLKNIRY